MPQWLLTITRQAQHRRGPRRRTYSAYEVTVDGAPIGLSGFVCEAPGPGDNTATGVNRRCIEAGTYGLQHQAGAHYATSGHQLAPLARMPALRLQDRGVRTDILIHPAHPAIPGFGEGDLFLSSLG